MKNDLNRFDIDHNSVIEYQGLYDESKNVDFRKFEIDLNRSDIDHNIAIECHICSTSVPGGNQVDGLPPASSTGPLCS